MTGVFDMPQPNLIMTVPQGALTAISLGVEGYAGHRSPGSGKFFQGRTVFVDLATRDLKPDFTFLDEGGWRDTTVDTANAMALAAAGKRTKTALSNSAFNCVPVDAYRRCFLVKTGGHVLEMDPGVRLLDFPSHTYIDNISADQIAATIGQPVPERRVPRLYLVLEPIEFVVMSSLTPMEYVWYATHRPGKIFRQILFTELGDVDRRSLAAETIFEEAYDKLLVKPGKKTKTVFVGDCLNRLPFHAWLGYDRKVDGGIYTGDRNGLTLWRFPDKIPAAWERAEG